MGLLPVNSHWLTVNTVNTVWLQHLQAFQERFLPTEFHFKEVKFWTEVAFLCIFPMFQSDVAWINFVKMFKRNPTVWPFKWKLSSRDICCWFSSICKMEFQWVFFLSNSAMKKSNEKFLLFCIAAVFFLNYCLFGFLFSTDDYVNSVTLGHILELLTFFVEHHTYHIKNYIISKDLLRRVLVLMKSQHKFLVLSEL